MRAAPVPCVVDLLAMMAEKPGLQFVSPTVGQLHDPAHLVQVTGLAIRRQSHHLVLAGVDLESGVVGERGVEEAERVREVEARRRCPTQRRRR